MAEVLGVYEDAVQGARGADPVHKGQVPEGVPRLVCAGWW